ncbi:hypothetical protein HMJ29_12840 [Hymenobacter taeanensis]|uniref:Spy/CpxP family protein refolding chaperone n=1 Tax=Hymenobacter taeanensis TaxID=2735321 RepID=A0A6M6BIC1_9BACT|nr:MULTISPECIES: hypothetical protein [Hymenobacter]QJX47779.1 hypothetical protein HMJ29_12840 [Hymenobacter taeanensis]UOQ82733.1 hypothetical protein MUN83_08225 [Hymenobacter sp. 5414T-23]
MLVLLAAVALTAGSVSAQTAPTQDRVLRQGQKGQGRMNMTPEQRADLQAQRLTKQLGLSADQATQVKSIALAEAQEMQSMRSNVMAGTDRRAAMQSMKATRDKYDTQLKAVLTPDQLTKYTQLREQQQERRQDGMENGKMKMKVKS